MDELIIFINIFHDLQSILSHAGQLLILVLYHLRNSLLNRIFFLLESWVKKGA